MAFQIIRPADRQGWLAQREKGIGSKSKADVQAKFEALLG